MATDRIRPATAADAPLFGAVGEGSSYWRAGADALLQRLPIHPPGNLIIEKAGQPVGMLLSVRIDDASALVDSDILRVFDLHREHGALWVVIDVLFIAGVASQQQRQTQQQQQQHDTQHAEETRLRDELLRHAILLARASQDVRAVLVPIRTPGRPAAQPPPPAAVSLLPPLALLLRREPVVQHHMACGARVLQPLPPSWWPSDDANGGSAGTPASVQQVLCDFFLLVLMVCLT